MTANSRAWEHMRWLLACPLCDAAPMFKSRKSCRRHLEGRHGLAPLAAWRLALTIDRTRPPGREAHA